MIFFKNILEYKSLSIVGTEKNTGKTETLNWVLKNLKNSGKTVAVTSIGIDGESVDTVKNTPKPEITIYEGMIFVTAEKFFLNKKFNAEILNIDTKNTPFGRLITAKARGNGKILLSGAADTFTLKKIIEKNVVFGAEITVVDGALSRLSIASPAITEAMILATGAAYSANIEALVRKTKFLCKLIDLEQAANIQKLQEAKNGVYILINNELHRLNIVSSLMISKISIEIIEKIKRCKNLVIFGILSDKLLDFLFEKNILKDITLIVKDFTNIFLSEEKYLLMKKFGGKINVLHKTNLIAVTVNPTSPNGIVLDSSILQKKLSEKISVPIINVRNYG
jgi:hypothetical protein